MEKILVLTEPFAHKSQVMQLGCLLMLSDIARDRSNTKNFLYQEISGIAGAK